ncbi:MFS transporter [Nocardia terpenica]|nr:MFS transporter [Nocardia terpenica]
MTAIETPPGVRARMVALFLGAAAMSLAMVTASTMSTLVAADSLGPGLSGLPSAAGVVGTAAGAALLTAVMQRRGRRAGLVTGYAIGAVGGVLAAVSASLIVLLVAGMVLLGVGNAAAQLSRYAAADLRPDRPGPALAAVVWAGTVGAVGGPLLLAPVSNAATTAGFSAGTGVFLLAALAVIVSAAAALSLPRATPAPPPSTTTAPLPPMRTALTAMLIAQIVMAAIMTAAPLDIHAHGHGLPTIGMVVSGHTFGMFALAPLTGLLLDRFGARRVIAAGLALLVLSCAATVLASSAGGLVLTANLFLLGYGWNLAYVGGSALITTTLPPLAQLHAQGAIESRIWSASALATLLSTLTFTLGGYSLLSLISLALLTIPSFLMLRAGSAVTARRKYR